MLNKKIYIVIQLFSENEEKRLNRISELLLLLQCYLYHSVTILFLLTLLNRRIKSGIIKKKLKKKKTFKEVFVLEKHQDFHCLEAVVVMAKQATVSKIMQSNFLLAMKFFLIGRYFTFKTI